LRADPKIKAAKTAKPATNDGEIDTEEEVGAGAGASAASEAPVSEKIMATTTTENGTTEEAERDTAIAQEGILEGEIRAGCSGSYVDLISQAGLAIRLWTVVYLGPRAVLSCYEPNDSTRNNVIEN
ncbi:hypothetical protein ACH5RR_041302, partial [Cinchona calisaya]